MDISDRDRNALERLCRALEELPNGDGGTRVALNDSQWKVVGEALKSYLGYQPPVAPVGKKVGSNG